MPLSASDLLVNARGEPAMGHALDREIPSADRIDLLNPTSAVRQFRWRTTLSGITGAELQLATDPFPIVTADGNANHTAAFAP